MGALIDLNADLGESFGQWRMGNDEEILGLVSSANVACGFHAGDPLVLRRTVAAAAARAVRIGAHVSYRDLAGFGRVFIDVEPERLAAEVLYQLGAIAQAARSCGVRVAYVKPHGALYNTIVHHDGQARAVVGAITDFNANRPEDQPPLALLGLPGSRSATLAHEAGIATWVEAFADRAYTADGTLVPRREPGAVLHDPDVIAARMVRLVTEGTIGAVDGTTITLDADSICVHGDNPEAIRVVSALRAGLEAAGVTIRAQESEDQSPITSEAVPAGDAR